MTIRHALLHIRKVIFEIRGGPRSVSTRVNFQKLTPIKRYQKRIREKKARASRADFSSVASHVAVEINKLMATFDDGDDDRGLSVDDLWLERSFDNCRIEYLVVWLNFVVDFSATTCWKAQFNIVYFRFIYNFEDLNFCDDI